MGDAGMLGHAERWEVGGMGVLQEAWQVGKVVVFFPPSCGSRRVKCSAGGGQVWQVWWVRQPAMRCQQEVVVQV